MVKLSGKAEMVAGATFPDFFCDEEGERRRCFFSRTDKKAYPLISNKKQEI